MANSKMKANRESEEHQVRRRTLSEVNQEAIDVLSREIGIADTLRFINQFRPGAGNYTEERKRLFAGMTVDDVVAEMRGESPTQP